MHRFSVLAIAAASLVFSLTAPVTASCVSDDYRCDSQSMFSKCDNDAWVQFACPSGTVCDINNFLSTHTSPCVTASTDSYTYGQQAYSPPSSYYVPPVQSYYSQQPAQSYSNDYGNGMSYKGYNYVAPSSYGNQNNYAQQASYGQQNGYGQQNSYGSQNGYGQQNNYGQSNYNSGKVYLDRRDVRYNSYTPQYNSYTPPQYGYNNNWNSHPYVSQWNNHYNSDKWNNYGTSKKWNNYNSDKNHHTNSYSNNNNYNYRRTY